MSNKTPTLRESNPFGISIERILLVKYDRSDEIDITSQFLELNIFQNLFEPTILAEMLIYDAIGLFVNYPLTGEESIIVELANPKGSASPRNTDFFTASADGARFPFGSPQETSLSSRTIYFTVKGIRNIKPGDNAREASYILELASEEYQESMRTKISHCYAGKRGENADEDQKNKGTVGEIAKRMYFDYVQLKVRERINPKKIKEMYVDREGDPSESIEYKKVIIPNLYFFQALNFLKHKALAQDSLTYNSWVSFENFYGYFFTTIQSIIKDQLESFGEEIKQRKYLYNSNFELVDGSDPDQLFRLISRYDVNNRFSSASKISLGYFRNQTISATIDREEIYVHEYPEDAGEFAGNPGDLGENSLNTSAYREIHKAPYDAIPMKDRSIENSPKIKYDLDTISEELRNLYHTDSNEFTLRRQRMSSESYYLNSLNQVDISIVVPADISLNVGQVIYAEFPELHGFNEISYDKYISGYFLITEIKHTISVGGIASSVLRINKDSYATELETNMKYTTNTSVTNKPITDPATGLPEGEE
jgi:hypothetical protein